MVQANNRRPRLPCSCLASPVVGAAAWSTHASTGENSARFSDEGRRIIFLLRTRVDMIFPTRKFKPKCPMKALIPILIATGIAAIFAVLIATVPVLFEPMFFFWVFAMLVLMATGEYHRNRHHHGPF
jgi:hypothetical protein